MRKVDLVVISDVHLGTYGCHAAELVQYLKSIQPKKLILNGDIIDGWQFKKKYFPKEHYQVIQVILKKMKKGTMVYYLTGNHDDFLRKISGVSMGNFKLKDHLVLNMDGKRHWFFHGDVFDASITMSPIIAKLGGHGYDFLIRINRVLNKGLEFFDKEPMSLSRKVKNSVKNAVKFINDFEKTAVDLAFHEGYDVVVCGHIHQPQIRKERRNDKEVTYLNSGDWVENLTALEYHNKTWKLYDYNQDSELHEEKKSSKQNTAPIVQLEKVI